MNKYKLGYQSEERSTAALFLLLSFLYILGLNFQIALSCFWSRVSQFCFDIASKSLENFCNIKIVFSTTFQEFHTIFGSQGFSFFFGNLSIRIRAITFIPYYNFGDIFRLRLIYLFDPILQTMKSFSIRNGVNQNNSGSSLIISLGDSFESLLTSSIPNLHFKFGAIYADSLDFKVNSNSRYMCHFVFLINISKKYIGFSNCCITNDDNFHQEIIFFFFFTS